MRGILWLDGALVAAREEIVKILRRLEPKGLPPFGAIAQLLAACRGKQFSISWVQPSDGELHYLRMPFLAESCGVKYSEHYQLQSCAEPEVLSPALDRLHSIPSSLGDLLVGEEDIAALVQILLGDVDAEKMRRANGVVEILENGGLTSMDLNRPPWNCKYTTLIQDLDMLAKGFKAVSVEALRSRLIESRGGRSS